MPAMPSEDQLLALKDQRIPITDLLALFHTRVRNDHSVLVISQALTDVGLSTLPSFATCSGRTEVHVVAVEAAPAPGPEEEDQEQDENGLSSGALPQQSFKIGDIPAARNGVDCVSSSAPLSQATYLMRTKNFSQVPVIDGQSTLHGVVTWSSVCKMYETGATPVLANAMVDDPAVAEAHQDFFSLLPMVSEHGYLLVRGSNGHFTGIVTTADITQRFEGTAWPFFVVGEIEFRLRRWLGAKIDPDAIRAVQPHATARQTGLITDLMFNGYVRLLDGAQQNPALCARADQNWQALGWGGDRIQFVHQLNRVRQIRNKIAHFDPEPLSANLTDELRQFVGLLRQLT